MQCEKERLNTEELCVCVWAEMHTDSMTQNILGCDDKQHCEQNERWVGGGQNGVS